MGEDPLRITTLFRKVYARNAFHVLWNRLKQLLNLDPMCVLQLLGFLNSVLCTIKNHARLLNSGDWTIAQCVNEKKPNGLFVGC